MKGTKLYCEYDVQSLLCFCISLKPTIWFFIFVVCLVVPENE